MNLWNDLTSAMERHRTRLFLWTATTASLLVAQLVVVTNVLASFIFFVIGAALMSVAGISCAYWAIRESR